MWAAKVEIERHDWSSYRAPQSVGPDIGEVFLHLVNSTCESAPARCSLESRLEVQSMVFEVALPAVGVILAAYSEDMPQWVEMEFLNALHNVITGEPHRSELDLGCDDLVERCITRAREGLWVMYTKLSRNNAAFMLDILEIVDLDQDRYRRFSADFRSKMGRKNW